MSVRCLIRKQHNGPEGPLATTTGKRDVSAFPHRRNAVAPVGESVSLRELAPLHCAIRVICALPATSRALSEKAICVGVAAWRAKARHVGHLKPPTRGTLTTSLFHMGRLSATSNQDTREGT